MVISSLIMKSHTTTNGISKKDILRFITCGNVDDGKSTLIGRLLHDLNLIYDDQLDAVAKDSASFGTQGKEIDLALLMDGLKAEKEQGITIDVAYRYFSTKNRRFIVADTPGHEQYTRNMITGASRCDVAVILIDATKGVLQQTKRHAFLVSLLGIRHFIVAVNKMDIVDYDQKVFDQIRSDLSDFGAKLEISDMHFIPISALRGDNVVNQCDTMPWYKGDILINLLDTIYIASDRNLIDMRFPVQYIMRSDAKFRGYAGTIASGIMRKGDEIVALPSGKKTKIKSIITADGELNKAYAPMSVVVSLSEEIDVVRGDMFVPVGNLPNVGSQIDVMLMWMSEEPLALGSHYHIKHTSHSTSAVIQDLQYKIDVNTLSRDKESSGLLLNEIGKARISTSEPLIFDEYSKNKSTGSFIIIDRYTNMTVGAAIILSESKEVDEFDHSVITKKAQRNPNYQYPIVWLTGNTGSGKSTLAFFAQEKLDMNVVVLDGDEMRDAISEREDLSAEGRRRHNLRVARLAKLIQSQGYFVIVSVIAPYEDLRREVHKICAPKWVYVKRSGITDKNRPYEEPKNPDFVIDNDVLNYQESLDLFQDIIRKI